MCCCGTPTVNGQPGYRWQPNDEPRVRPVDPPELQEGDQLLVDEPGRCGGLDSHSHHVRLVLRHNEMLLLVRNGSGDHEVRLPYSFSLSNVIQRLDSDTRYWLLLSFYNVASASEISATSKAVDRWSKAAAEKRIKVRRRRGTVKVWIEP